MPPATGTKATLGLGLPLLLGPPCAGLVGLTKNVWGVNLTSFSGKMCAYSLNSGMIAVFREVWTLSEALVGLLAGEWEAGVSLSNEVEVLGEGEGGISDKGEEVDWRARIASACKEALRIACALSSLNCLRSNRREAVTSSAVIPIKHNE